MGFHGYEPFGIYGAAVGVGEFVLSRLVRAWHLRNGLPIARLVEMRLALDSRLDDVVKNRNGDSSIGLNPARCGT